MAEPQSVQLHSYPGEDETDDIPVSGLSIKYTRNPLRQQTKGVILEPELSDSIDTEESTSGFGTALDRFNSTSKDFCLGTSVYEVDAHTSPDNVSQYTSPLVLLPDTNFRRIWDCSQGVILIYIAIMVPIRVAFNYPSTGFFFYLEFIIDIYFFVDLGLNFFTAQQSEDPDANMITDLRKIAIKYACSWFVVDFVATIPVDLITSYLTDGGSCFDAPGGCDIEGSSGQLLKLVKLLRATRLLKLLRLTRLNRLLDRYSEELIYYNSVIHILKFVGTLQFASHLFACLYGTVYDFKADGYHSV
ncbi:hypothetical protein CYMTET_11012 [Cymbomonas tetramitiformis]|uniref:Ion transport domain-containing protein n=1 Tax=Cymbomonas tetramitiformis TaxID=36881 RepID=A0AAE0GNK3_9CHLO|nr:hypothetical protein CYMTET_11012 [Cymbomonas tetramitiformis]